MSDLTVSAAEKADIYDWFATEIGLGDDALEYCRYCELWTESCEDCGACYDCDECECDY